MELYRSRELPPRAFGTEREPRWKNIVFFLLIPRVSAEKRNVVMNKNKLQNVVVVVVIVVTVAINRDDFQRQ